MKTKAFIKWAGGKEKELPFIMDNLPDNFDRYVEPFVGGGAVYFDINKQNSIINDKSDELINLYKLIHFLGGNGGFEQCRTRLFKPKNNKKNVKKGALLVPLRSTACHVWIQE